MGDDGSLRYLIRDQIDPVFSRVDLAVGKRTAEKRRLAGGVIEARAGTRGS